MTYTRVTHYKEEVNKRKLLIMDSFIGHKGGVGYIQYNWDVCMILGGCTKYLQPLDISVNRSFKWKMMNKPRLYKTTVQRKRHHSMGKMKMEMVIKNVNKTAYQTKGKSITNGFRRMQEAMEGVNWKVKTLHEKTRCINHNLTGLLWAYRSIYLCRVEKRFQFVGV